MTISFGAKNKALTRNESQRPHEKWGKPKISFLVVPRRSSVFRSSDTTRKRLLRRLYKQFPATKEIGDVCTQTIHRQLKQDKKPCAQNCWWGPDGA